MQLVICGLGGQGILFLMRVIAEAAILEGSDVITAETHGMAQRGGAVDAHVKIGGYEGSLVRRGRADAVLAIDASRAGHARSFMREGGRFYMSAPNMLLLGSASAAERAPFPSQDALLRVIEALSPPAAREQNRETFLKEVR